MINCGNKNGGNVVLSHFLYSYQPAISSRVTEILNVGAVTPRNKKI